MNMNVFKIFAIGLVAGFSGAAIFFRDRRRPREREKNGEVGKVRMPKHTFLYLKELDDYF